MKTKQEQIDEMVKVIKGFDICGLFGRCFSTGADGENTRFITCPECFAEALYNAGYGDVSEYKAEIEQLKAKNKVLGDGVAKAFTNGFNTGRKQVEKDIRRAKINAMIELKEKIVEHMGECEYMGVKYKQGVFSESEIDELVKEVQNGEDKG